MSLYRRKTSTNSEWVCYLIRSLDTNATYIGVSNNQPRRLSDHNSTKKGRKGAKRTRNQAWVPVLVVSGFCNRYQCLSFESGWKRLHATRRNDKFLLLNLMTQGLSMKYTTNPTWNRIADLVYFVRNTTLLDDKFRINHDDRLPHNTPSQLTFTLHAEYEIENLPWPWFVTTRIADQL